MTQRDRDRLVVLKKAQRKLLRQREAAEELGLSERHAAFDRYLALYCEVVRRRSADPELGPKLHGMLVEAGRLGVQVRLVQPVHVNEEGKEISVVTRVNIAEAVLAEGLATEPELGATIAELEKFTAAPASIIGVPRIFRSGAGGPDYRRSEPRSLRSR